MRLAHFRGVADAHLALAVVAKPRGLENAGQHGGERIVVDGGERLRRLDHDVRRDRHARGGNKALLGDAVLRHGHAAPCGAHEGRFGERIEARGGHVLELGRDGRTQAREFGQRGFVVVGGAQMTVGDGARGARRIRIEHGDAVAHRLGRKTEHAAELAATDHAEPGAGKDR